jgi:hypothetical protein
MTTHITKTWFDGEKVVTQEIPESEVYKQEPVAWRNAAIRLGEELSSVGPDGYYNMTAEQWLDWAMDQHPQGKNSLTTPPAQPAQEFVCSTGLCHYKAKRPWVGLTDEERRGIREWQTIQEGLGPIWAPMMLYLYMAIEQRLKEKNNG